MNLGSVPDVAAHELDRLRAYDWPGNVRELQNIVERALILSRGGRLHSGSLAHEEAAYPRSPWLASSLFKTPPKVTSMCDVAGWQDQSAER